MSSLTDVFENQLIDFIFRGQALTLPGSLHVGLFTVAAGEAGGQTEVVGGTYRLRNLITTSGGRQDSREIVLMCTARRG